MVPYIVPGPITDGEEELKMLYGGGCRLNGGAAWQASERQKGTHGRERERSVGLIKDNR